MRRRSIVAVALLSALLVAWGPIAPAHADSAAVAKRLGNDFRRAWQVTRGQGATVAVLSSGVDTHVRTLAGKVIQGPDFYKGRPKRINGTLLASLIAGSGPTSDSPFGIRGLAPAAKILAVRVREEDGEPAYEFRTSTTFRRALAKGIRYATDRGADVILLDEESSSEDTGDDVLRAVNYALSKNVVIVGMAYGAQHAPASLPGVIGVAGLSADGRGADAYSAEDASVLVGAPSVRVLTTGPRNRPYLMWGSFAAAAWVAATAALVKAEYPRLSSAQVGRAIALSAHHPKGGYHPLSGFGMINPAGALKQARAVAKETGVASTGAVADGVHFGGGVRPIEVVQRDTRVLGGALGVAGAGALGLAIVLVLAVRGRRRATSPGHYEPPAGPAESTDRYRPGAD